MKGQARAEWIVWGIDVSGMRPQGPARTGHHKNKDMEMHRA